jgi:Methyltransferase FkbM domain
MSTLRDYANDTGQWGEGGMITEALRRMKIEPSFAVEFGIGDDPALVNTWDLALAGVSCFWCDSDSDQFNAMAAHVDDANLGSVAIRHHRVDDVDSLAMAGGIDVLSIDVDGEDYRQFEAMTIQPPLVVIEHNPTVPPHINWIGQGPREGASARALVRLANSKNYALVGATGANLIFVAVPYDLRFRDLETDLEVIFDRSQLNYVISDYDGNWGTTGPWAFSQGEFRGFKEEVRT